jgi:hypothetical protein
MRADRWLSLAAAPVFAVMALLTGVFGGGPVDALCSVAGAPLLSGMVPMYLLMSALHLSPWLKLISGWKSNDRGLEERRARSAGSQYGLSDRRTKRVA